MKKIIAIASVILIFIIIILLLVLRKKSTTDSSLIFPYPTNVSFQKSSTQNNQLSPSNPKELTKTESINQNLPSDSKNLTNLPFDISTITPVENEDFKLYYSSKLNKIVVERKTSLAEEQFRNWANQNQLTQLVKDPNLILFVDQGENPDDFNPLLEFLNIFMNFGQGIKFSIPDQPAVTSIPPQNLPTGQGTPPSNFTYYAQCNGYGNIALPGGCNLCRAGCGPTTVAMIAASYLGSNYNPKTIVDQYQSKGYLLGCSGSSYSDAYEVLNQLGLKTTEHLVYNFETVDKIVPDLKKYLNAGWTFFTLARFCDDPKIDYCSHFFWITDIDDQGNIFAYDPAYGRYQIPYNENSRYPYPLYRRAFGVKK